MTSSFIQTINSILVPLTHLFLYEDFVCYILRCCWPSHSQSSLHSVTQFPEHCLPKNFSLPWPCLQANSFPSQFLLTPALLSLVSTWHLSHCFQAHTSSPCLFPLLFKLFFLLLLSNTAPSLYRFSCRIRAVLASLFQHQPLPCCLFMLLLTVHHHIQQK